MNRTLIREGHFSMATYVSWIKRGVVVALLFAGPAPLFAQATGTVAGTVFGAVTERPVAGVRLQVLGTVVSATSGQDGKYTIRGVPVGTHTIRASAIGRARSKAAPRSISWTLTTSRASR